MSRYLFFAFSDCKDPAREDEYNEWYCNMHVPDILEIPGMIRATRWVGATDKPGQTRKYLAMYELETDDIEKFDEKVREKTMETIKKGRFSNLPVFDPPEIPGSIGKLCRLNRPKILEIGFEIQYEGRVRSFCGLGDSEDCSISLSQFHQDNYIYGQILHCFFGSSVT
jgi:hypothetical protein